MMIYAFLLAVLYAGSCTGQGFCAIDQKCYIPCPDYTLADAFPFARQTPITCEECMNLCNSMQTGPAPFVCQSAVFDSLFGSCDIFAVSDQSFGFGRRKRGGMPHKQKYPGRIFLQPTGLCAGQGGNGTGSSTASGATTTAAGATTAATTTTSPAGAVTTAASTASTSAVARRKMMRDQQAIRRRDDVGIASKCLAHRTSDNKRDCTRGIKFVGRSRVTCTPTHDECISS